jgi:hypothetical protein
VKCWVALKSNWTGLHLVLALKTTIDDVTRREMSPDDDSCGPVTSENRLPFDASLSFPRSTDVVRLCAGERDQISLGMEMPTSAELEARIKRINDWRGLRGLWREIRSGSPRGWEAGEAFEHMVLRAFELDPDEPATVRYPYEVPLFGVKKVEEIDGAIHLPGLSCLVESKDWRKNVAVGPIVKMRSQLLRRPAGTIGIIFSRKSFTEPAIYLAHFTMPQAVLLWSEFDLEVVMQQGRICRFLRLKYRVCCEDGIPDYDLREANIP